jgi:NMD protein affecting ribosome stability and mRNA decay
MSLEQRRRQAEFIIREPIHYMVCEGCGSISNRKLCSTCPVCHAYRFIYDETFIQERAAEMGSREAETCFED